MVVKKIYFLVLLSLSFNFMSMDSSKGKESSVRSVQRVTDDMLLVRKRRNSQMIKRGQQPTEGYDDALERLMSAVAITDKKLEKK